VCRSKIAHDQFDLTFMETTNPFQPLKSELSAKPARSNHFMRIIALGRFVYGIVLLGLGLAVFHLIGKNLAAELLKLITNWHIETHFYYVHWLLQEVAGVSYGLLVLLAIMNFFYAALAFAETAGLLYGKRWAYWLVILDTASFIPVEIIQLSKQFNWINLVLLLYFIGTVIYLLFEVGRLPQPNANVAIPLAGRG
jgi:uncharacterized membrane protein (DUF2068 family)